MPSASPSLQVPAAASSDVLVTDIPARLDRLSWSRFHTLVVVALGITWILDGLEVTLAGSVSGALKSSPALRMTDAQVGLSAWLTHRRSQSRCRRPMSSAA